MANGDKPRQWAAHANNAGQLYNYESAMDNYVTTVANDRQLTDFKNDERYENWRFQNELQNFQYGQQIRAYEHSMNIYGLNQLAIDKEVKFQEDQIYRNADARIQELHYMKQDLDFAFAREQIETNFAIADLKLQIESTDSQLKINSLQNLARDRQFGADMQQQSSQITDSKAEARRQFFKNELDRQKSAGQAAASGKRGQSVQMVENAIDAISAVDSSALMSQLERGQLNFKNVTSNSVYQKKKQDQISAKEKDMLVTRRKQQQNQTKQIQTLFGLSVEEFEADTKKLGQMMIDTYAGIDDQLEMLAKNEFQTRVNLYAQSPLPPMLAPRAKPPRSIPYTNYTEPRIPPFFDHKSAGGTPAKPQKPSGLSIAAGIIGTGLGIAGTLATGGALGATVLGTSAAAGGSILTGLGAGFTTASGFLR